MVVGVSLDIQGIDKLKKYGSLPPACGFIRIITKSDINLTSDFLVSVQDDPGGEGKHDYSGRGD